MKIAARTRVTTRKDRLVTLEIQCSDGTMASFLMPGPGAKAAANQLRDGAAAAGGHQTKWISTRYQIAPGSPGGWEVGAPDNGLLPIVFHIGEAMQVELLLPPEDSARLVEQIALARSVPPMPKTPNA